MTTLISIKKKPKIRILIKALIEINLIKSKQKIRILKV